MMKALKEHLTQLGAHLYCGTRDEDILIAEWWDRVFGTEEFGNLISSSARSLSALYGLFKPPKIMVYTVADGAIESLHWIEPTATSDGAVFFSSWSSPKLRGTKRQALLMATIFSLIFAMGKKTIIGITKQEKLLNLHKGLGYVIVGQIPNLFDAEPAWIMYLDRAGLEASRLWTVANKIKNKEYS